MTGYFLLLEGEKYMSNETKNHKDNVFCLLYSEKKNLLSLYNAMNGTSYGNEEELKKIAPPGRLHRTSKVPIPVPRFVVFYNGVVPQPECRENREEIVEMGICEFDQEVYDQVLREDAEAIGIRKGDLKRLVSQICKKMKMNQSMEKIAEDLAEEVSVIEPIYRAAEGFAPDYDPDAVFKQVVSIL